VLVFVAAGPPIGGFALVVVSLSVGVMRPSLPGSEPTTPQLGLVLTIIFFSYFLGAGPAALVGLIIGIKQAFFGPTSWRMALFIGLAAGFVFVERLGVIDRRDFEGTDGSPLFPALLVLTCVIPTMWCWALVRDWHFAPTPLTEAAP
jgi:hypothetical protein